MGKPLIIQYDDNMIDYVSMVQSDDTIPHFGVRVPFLNFEMILEM